MFNDQLRNVKEINVYSEITNEMTKKKYTTLP